ncbi:hypothetical protein PRUPE_4G238700 [Prunus persica]|uniref:Uncharacterized protein n=1 Tax=Prunus persica TaxID=3760 RepID=A0A251PQ99_PRUPE|nr:hypothetical protein PRUPE_4G238700 [Prunus persica]
MTGSKKISLLTLINGSLHHKVLTTVATKTTGRDTWVALKTRFASPNQNSLLQLRSDFLYTTCGDSFIIDFLDRINFIIDNLAFAGAPVSDSDLLVVVMNNVCPLHENIVAAAQAQDDVIDTYYVAYIKTAVTLNNETMSVTNI